MSVWLSATVTSTGLDRDVSLESNVCRLVSLWEEAPTSLFQQPVDSYAGGSFVHVLWVWSLVRISLYCSRQGKAGVFRSPESQKMLSFC